MRGFKMYALTVLAARVEVRTWVEAGRVIVCVTVCAGSVCPGAEETEMAVAVAMAVCVIVDTTGEASGQLQSELAARIILTRDQARCRRNDGRGTCDRHPRERGENIAREIDVAILLSGRCNSDRSRNCHDTTAPHRH